MSFFSFGWYRANLFGLERVTSDESVILRSSDGIFKHAPIPFNHLYGSCVVVVAGNQNRVNAQLLTREYDRQPENRGRVSLAAVFREHNITNVAAFDLERRIQRVTNRGATNNGRPSKSKEESGRNMIWQQVLTALAFGKQLEIAAQAHVFRVLVKDIRNSRDDVENSPELVLILFGRATQDKARVHVSLGESRRTRP
jgi:hypothetical protein